MLSTVLLLHSAMLGWSATRHSPTIDEPMHLAAGLECWKTGRCLHDRGNPPPVGMWAALPLALSGAELPDGDKRPFAPVLASMQHLVPARWATIPFSVLGAWACYAWARELYGKGAGWLALGLWCVCPTILGHGALVTGDVPAAAVGVTACYALWRWLKAPGWADALAGGVLLGAAQLSKFVWLPLWGLWPLLWAACAWRRGRADWPRLGKQCGQLAAMLALAALVLHAGYLFEHPFPALRDTGLLQLGADRNLPAGPARVWLQKTFGDVPVPVPLAFARGLADMDRVAGEGGRIFLNGRWHDGPVWHYYLAALGMKVPLGTLALVAAAALRTVLPRRRIAISRTDLALVAPPIAVLTVASAFAVFNHVRYVLPVLPFAFVWASQVASVATTRARAWRAFAIGAWLLSLASSLACWPHSLSYFNELAGGPAKGRLRLIDSNVDWGQDLLYLKQWYDAHPEARPFHLAYFGRVDPGSVGLDYSLPPRAKDKNDYVLLRAGWYAVSVSLMHGLNWWVCDEHGNRHATDEVSFGYFQRLAPVDRAGYSILIFHVPEKPGASELR